MKRITPEDVVDAYIATGMCRSPARFVREEICGCCALMALHLSEGGSVPLGLIKAAALGAPLGLDAEYCSYFSMGFDSDVMISLPPSRLQGLSDEKRAGYQDGLAAQRAVTAHFAKAPATTEPVACESV